MTKITLNGKQVVTEANTVKELIQTYGLEGKPIAVEVDGVIVSPFAWEEHQLENGMTIEMVHFVGGG